MASFMCDRCYRNGMKILADYLVTHPERTGTTATCAEDLHKTLWALRPDPETGIEIMVTVLPLPNTAEEAIRLGGGTPIGQDDVEL